MPSRKQRRRREKGRRHEWEYVYVDEEGREVEPDSVDVEPTLKKQAAQNGTRARGGSGARTAAGGRAIQPPSWGRVLRRGAIFAPFMFLTLTFLGGEMTVATRLIQTAWLLAMFIPFSYLLDRAMYRRFTKASRSSATEPARRRSPTPR